MLKESKLQSVINTKKYQAEFDTRPKIKTKAMKMIKRHEKINKTTIKKRNLGRIDLYFGDCLDVIPKIKAEVSLTFLDPPFNQGKEYENHNDLMDGDDYWAMMKKVCRLVNEKTSSGGAIYFMHREKNLSRILNILNETGWHFQNLIIWKKMTSAVPMQHRFGKNYQIIVFATKTKTPATFNKLRIAPPPLLTTS